MLDIVHPRFDRPLQPVAAVRMARDEHPTPVRLVHYGLQFLETGKRLVHHLSTRLEVERAGGMDLHVIRTVVRQLPHACPQAVHAVGYDLRLEWLSFQRVSSVAGSGDREDRSGGPEARTLHQAAVDRSL